MNIKKLEPVVEKREEPYEFYEVLELLSQSTDLAFSCDEFRKGQYVAFDYDDFKLSFYSKGTEIVDDDENQVTIKVDKTKLRKEDFLVTLDCFERKWVIAHLKDSRKIYDLEVIYDYSFSDDDVMSSLGKSFDSLTEEEILDFLYEIAEDVVEEKPQFFIDGKPFP